MEKLVLGLDLGITSVGYGLVNGETGKIIDAGVRLFDEGTVWYTQKIISHKEREVDGHICWKAVRTS